jgi:hypothetical protein
LSGWEKIIKKSKKENIVYKKEVFRLEVCILSGGKNGVTDVKRSMT